MHKNAVLAKIHIAKRALGLTDEAYRDILHLHFQVASSKQLTARQVTVLLNQLKAKGWQPKTSARTKPRSKSAEDRINSVPREAETAGRITVPPGPAARQQRKVLALWNALGYDMGTLHTRVQTQFGVARFEWLTDYKELHVLITDLEARVRRMNAANQPSNGKPQQGGRR
mgnify:CR=1 FL=1